MSAEVGYSLVQTWNSLVQIWNWSASNCVVPPSCNSFGCLGITLRKDFSLLLRILLERTYRLGNKDRLKLEVYF